MSIYQNIAVDSRRRHRGHDAIDALEYARSVVHEDLRSLKTEGMSGEDLYTQYTMFGTEPQIVSAG